MGNERFMGWMLHRAQAREIDRLAVEKFQIPGLLLMENAGRNAAEIIQRHYGLTRASIVCGAGNNGGDGCVIGRHLHLSGSSIRLLMTGRPESLTPDTRTNFRIVEAIGLECTVAENSDDQVAWAQSIREDDVVVDALLGTGFQGQVRHSTARLIATLNSVPRRAMVAVDVPSGLDCDTGRAGPATIRADLTITFVGPKVGFFTTEAKPFVGRIEVADIGAPRHLLEAALNAANSTNPRSNP